MNERGEFYTVGIEPGHAPTCKPPCARQPIDFTGTAVQIAAGLHLVGAEMAAFDRLVRRTLGRS